MIDKTIKKVLVIGSGPIIIGQAAEFDYAGTQACRSLKEEGIEVVLVNSNPATIMTDGDIADKVYIEPLNVPTLTKIIEKEKPDSILPTLGGQTGLNLAMELDEKGVLKANGVRLIGIKASSIKKAEDRQEFKDTMEKIGEPCIESLVVHDVEAAVEFSDKIGYPVIVRPAYTLGGTGGGIADDEEELREICSNGLRLSRVNEVLIEKCIAGWKEIEYEVMRDGKGNCITVCNMENLDPVGVHTGDSIVVAPSQTLMDKEYQMLRSAALNIITELGIEGGCNVQFALHPDSFRYAVIEVNPRVSRSSALASKATGYPIARIAAKIALGLGLDEIPNAITKKTYASFEPALDYCVVKIPKWPFDKFVNAKRTPSAFSPLHRNGKYRFIIMADRMRCVKFFLTECARKRPFLPTTRVFCFAKCRQRRKNIEKCGFLLFICRFCAIMEAATKRKEPNHEFFGSAWKKGLGRRKGRRAADEKPYGDCPPDQRYRYGRKNGRAVLHTDRQDIL